MVIYQNISYDVFASEYNDKKIICFGGGTVLREFFRVQYANIGMMHRIVAIINNDRQEGIDKFNIHKLSIPIMSVESFASKYPKDDYVILLLVSNANTASALEQLDEMDFFDKIPCCYGISAVMWCHEEFYSPYPAKVSLPLCKEKYDIPKIIHYCWFGKGEMSELNKACIESWKKNCTEYTLMLWNEDNYDISQAPLYVRQAYSEKKYAFVSDYVRLDVMYNYGGFYFDTDVEVLRNIDVFCSYKAVFAFMEYGEIATGLGFASVAKNSVVYDLMKIYEDIVFVDEGGQKNMTPCPCYTDYYFRTKGVRTNNTLQIIDDMLFLPSDFFCPLSAVRDENGLPDLTIYALDRNTYAIHKCENTWKEESDRAAFERKKEKYVYINNRLLADWKKMRVE